MRTVIQVLIFLVVLKGKATRTRRQKIGRNDRFYIRTRRNPYTTTFYQWNDISAMFYSAHITSFHSHNTLQLIIDVGGEFRFRTPEKAWNVHKSLLIKENVVHQLDTSRGVQLIVYIEESGDLAECLRARYLSGRETCSFDEEMLFLENPGQFQQCMLSSDSRLLEQLIRQLLTALRSGELTRVIDERVRNAIRLINADRSGELTIARIARELYLSESRLRSLFKTDMGISLHQYILLRKSNLSLTRIMNGANIAEAAAAGGFADSSHFHRVMLHLFGVSPSRFMRANERKRTECVSAAPLRVVTSLISA
jgi:AraC-like DNA-binding protein